MYSHEIGKVEALTATAREQGCQGQKQGAMAAGWEC